ncbi:fumarylacetoacetase [Arenicella chitinivorans]|uniref:fumarylacetoacetase n=1 Tax=Arenicella chitinivorans TaxID=1329800 RepID=A0A918VQ85_9GAMM|nr:fumarylacetoacetase [Arenicella chitinivorans]GHA13737.1 fumarylacetoacetase [Arenicella chitinivorans]
MMSVNHTHNPALKSWVESANQPDSDFPIQNLPFGIFRRRGTSEPFRAGIAIGDQILDMQAAHAVSAFDVALDASLSALSLPKLNTFMSLGQGAWSAVREAVSAALAVGSSLQDTLAECLVAQSEAEYDVPAHIGDYTDFYTSINHATNVGKLFRPDNPLLPNYQWIPIGYHGRSSSIAISGHSFHRPNGQLKAPDAEVPVLAPCKRLDYELEVGIYIGTESPLGHPVKLADAEQHVFGLCMFNDWSARDIQAWEYQPLGPFLSKSFASTVSPWIVTMEALAPFRQSWTRPAEDPQPLPYLDSHDHRNTGAVNMHLEVLIQTAKMRADGVSPERLALSNFNQSYWTIAQMVTHHTVNGCNLKPGDFFGSGTQSGISRDSVGALIEATVGGREPITLSNGEQRTFLEDGDTVTLKGWCQNDSAVRIGFGEAAATVLPAIDY